MGKSKKPKDAPSQCKACGSPNLMVTGLGEYTCYRCGQVVHVKTSEQSKF